MTDRTMRKTDELRRSQQERVAVLEEQIQELEQHNEQLEAEIFSLRKMGALGGEEGLSVLCDVFVLVVIVVLWRYQTVARWEFCGSKLRI